MPEKIYQLTDKFNVPEHCAGHHHNYTNNSVVSRHQTDFSYDPNNYFQSENRIQPRLMYREAESLICEAELPAEIINGFVPKNSFAMKPFFEHLPDLSDRSGFMVEYTCSSNEPVEALLRVTFYEDDGEGEYNIYASGRVRSFMSSAKIGEGENRRIYFDTTKLPFPADVGSMKIEVISLKLTTRLTVTVNRICAVNALDMRIKFRGQRCFYDTDGSLDFEEKQGLTVAFKNGFYLNSAEFPGTNDNVYNMLLPRRNTVFAVIANDSDADKITVSLRTTRHDWRSKEFDLEPRSGKKAYYFNFSDVEGLSGHLKQFRFEVKGGTGRFSLYTFTFEEEKKIEKLPCESVSCLAEGDLVNVIAALKEPLAKDCTALLYRTSMADELDVPQGKKLVAKTELHAGDKAFRFTTPLKYGKVTEFTSQFLIFLRNENGTEKFCDRFYVENAADYIQNKYAFELPDRSFSVLDFGAKGDAFTDDTDAIQDAINTCSEQGGGRVLIPGDGSFYGRRYLITNLCMKSNVDLHIEKGAVLWQDQDPDDYCFIVTYGHDGYIEGVNWTHCLHVCNLPLIHVPNVDNVKISGKGKIRSMDTGSEEGVVMPGYACGCPDRIHQITIGGFNAHNISLTDFEIVRANNYHMSLYHCDNISIIGIKMHEVKCVSGDGIGLGTGGHDALIANVFFQSNDDAVTISSAYNDPREILWWCCIGETVCSTRNVEICHSYMNSGGGKCIAFIPWGTVMRYYEHATIKNIDVYDCYLSGVNPVGAWADDPFYGRFPFDNAETDDYAPAMEVRIHDNVYDGNNMIYPLKITDFLSDCGLTAPSDFQNKDFSQGGFANWNVKGEVKHFFDPKTRREAANVTDGRIYQGLFLEAGQYELCFETKADSGENDLFITGIPEKLRVDPKDVALKLPYQEKEVRKSDGNDNVITVYRFEIPEGGSYYVGLEGKNTILQSAALNCKTDPEAIKARKIKESRDVLSKVFKLEDHFVSNYNPEDGQITLIVKAPADGEIRMNSLEAKRGFVLKNAFKLDGRINGANTTAYGFILESEKAVYRLTLDEASVKLILSKEADGKTEILYEKTNFYFTSNNFHNFEIDRSIEGELTIFVDNGMFASILTGDETPAKVSMFADNCLMQFNRIVFD